MPTTDLLKTFGLSRNPFTDRTAEKTVHDVVSLYIHSDLRGFRPSETTYVFFGKRGSGKTTIRLQVRPRRCQGRSSQLPPPAARQHPIAACHRRRCAPGPRARAVVGAADRSAAIWGSGRSLGLRLLAGFRMLRALAAARAPPSPPRQPMLRSKRRGGRGAALPIPAASCAS